MTAFLIVAVLLVGAALLFLMPPLVRPPQAQSRATRAGANLDLYRDELAELQRERQAGQIGPERFAEAKREIERRALDEGAEAAPGGPADSQRRVSWWIAGPVGLAVPLVALLGYAALGNPDALRPQRAAAAAAPHAIGPEQIAAMAERLAQRLKQAPADAEGWAMLARSLRAIGRYEESAQAYGRLAALTPQSADVLADQADALAMARGRKLLGEPLEIVERALRIDPNHVKSLALAGSAEFERRNFAAAVSHWEHALANLPPEAQFAQSLRASLEQARTGVAAGGSAPAR